MAIKSKRRLLPRQNVKIAWQRNFGKKSKDIGDRVLLKDYIFAAIIVNLVLILLVLVLAKRLPPQVPLFYGLPISEGQLVPNYLLFIPAVVSILIILLNTFLSFSVKNEFLKKTLIVSAIASVLFPLITIVKIISLVGYF